MSLVPSVVRGGEPADGPARCPHWGTAGEEYMGLSVISYNCMWFYTSVQVKLLKRRLASVTVMQVSRVLLG